VLAFRLFGGTPPTASFSVLTAPAFPGTPIAFDGSASSDADGSITSHAWDFGDGSSGSGATPTHAYASPGTYTVTLNVTDSDLLTASTSASVSVSAPPILRPILSKLKIAPSAVIAANKGATFTRRKTGATVSFVDSLAGVTTLTVQKPKRGVRKGKSCIAPPRKPAKRKAKRCTRWVKVGSAASHKDVAGLNRLHFTGRVNRKKLAPGRYRLRAVARLGGQAGPPVTKSFRIVRK
jgi:hypothetical protein